MVTIQYSSSGIAGPLFPWGQSRYNLDLSNFWRFLIIIFNTMQIVAREIVHILSRCSPSFWPHCLLASGFSVLFLPRRWPLLPSHVFVCFIHLFFKDSLLEFLKPLSGFWSFSKLSCIPPPRPLLLPTVHFFRRTIWFPFSNLNSVKNFHLHSLAHFIGISFFLNIYFYLFVVCAYVHTLYVWVP